MTDAIIKPLSGEKEYKRTQSRKWRLVLLVLTISTLAFLVPPMISLWIFKAKSALFLLTGAEWVSIITIVVSAYFGANVFQKHVEKKAENELVQINTTATVPATSGVADDFVKLRENGEA